MHPAKSVIFFTTTSGAGYGMMVWLALLAAIGELPADPVFALVSFGLGLALIVSGLLSSTLHLGHPERAWRAFSQWRSSWLSREGVAAILTFVPLTLFAFAWVLLENHGKVVILLALVGAAMSLVTVYTTSMIYASLKAIPAWHTGWTVAGYLVLGPMNGATILTFLAFLFGHGDTATIMRLVTLAALVFGLGVKLLYWRKIFSAGQVSTVGSATGLGHLGKVQMTASPHDSENFLLREMGFQIARRHAEKLRRNAILLGFLIPVLCLSASIGLENLTATILLCALAALTCQIGIACERWLFFAEARHVVMLYYGEQSV